MNVLLVGGGGREHALARVIARSPNLGTLYITHPGNPGLAELGTPVDVPVDIREIYRLEQFCNAKKIHLVVIGPEDPLAEGYADKLHNPKVGRYVFGPVKESAQLESDKSWAKDLLRSAAIPTAEGRTFTDAEGAAAYIRSRREPPVVKAAGLAKGKGVIVASTADEAIKAAEAMLNQRAYGTAGERIIIEERLSGPEVSVFAVTDGSTILILPPCQDHKRLGDNDTGPNTGGMGAYCPTPLLDADTLERVEREILLPLVDTMRRERLTYRGVLYAGLMLTHSGPKVLEFNVRFGDPECQPLMARLESDALDLLYRCANSTLDHAEVRWSDRPTVSVVLAAAGYPDKPRAGDVITGIDKAAAMTGVTIDLAGVMRDKDGTLRTAGGRILCVTAIGNDLRAARDLAYAAASRIHFDGRQMRTDIASAALPSTATTAITS